jgi:hypothetical protein
MVPPAALHTRPRAYTSIFRLETSSLLPPLGIRPLLTASADVTDTGFNGLHDPQVLQDREIAKHRFSGESVPTS